MFLVKDEHKKTREFIASGYEAIESSTIGITTHNFLVAGGTQDGRCNVMSYAMNSACSHCCGLCYCWALLLPHSNSNFSHCSCMHGKVVIIVGLQ